eukprot:gene40707-50364_t
MAVPRRPPDTDQPPAVRLERVSVNGSIRSAPVQEALTLPPGQATLAIQYSANTLLNAERARFRYQMEGLARGWIDAGPNREVSFPALPHGSYRFRVSATIDGKRWSEPGPVLAVTVQPFFHETYWFAGLLLTAIAAGIYALFRLRVRHLRARHVEMERL